LENEKQGDPADRPYILLPVIPAGDAFDADSIVL
jgi:hypothetical protein